MKIDPTVVTEQRGQPLKDATPTTTARTTRNSSLDNQKPATPQQPTTSRRKLTSPQQGVPPTKKYRSYESEFEEEYHGPGVPAHLRAAKVVSSEVNVS